MLELDQVSNPIGAFLPAFRPQAQKKFRSDLMCKYGISFNALYTFANVPLGRFRTFLERSGNLEGVLERTYRPALIPAPCRAYVPHTGLSLAGAEHDCDFNLAAWISHGGEATLISALLELPPQGTSIPVADHCYACTVGSGFT